MVKNLLVLFSILSPCALYASQLPFGFTEQLIAQNLDPTDLVITPGGRVLITIKSGKVMVVEDDVLLTDPLLDIVSSVDNFNERGLGHIALDPDFATNGYFYLYYTRKGENRNRISRFTAVGNTSDPASETVLLDLDVLAGNIHNGGELVFGPEGKLYISTGDGASSSNAQSMTSLLGKVLRINADGSIPDSNPFYTSGGGNYNAIWALGFRNPFSMDIQPGTGKVFLGDVGGGWREEINHVQAGKNHGWPLVEGFRGSQTVPSNYMDPLYAYAHGDGPDRGCSVVGAAFYNPPVNQFPDIYTGKYFFADYCNGYIKYIDPVSGAVSDFITDITRPLAIHIAPDGSLYYLSRAGIGGGSATDNTSTTDGTLWKVSYTGTGAPHISVPPQSVLAGIGQTVIFSVTASGDEPLSYLWQLDGATIEGAGLSTYTLEDVQLSDSGKKFRCIVTNAIGSDTSEYAILNVTANAAPVPTLTWTLPDGNTLYRGGDKLVFSGAAVDEEDEDLPASALTWRIDFHHDTHAHPALDEVSNVASGEFIVPQVGETSDNVWFRIYLTATDNDGISSTVYQEIFPMKTDITLETTPAGIELMLDGQPVNTPYTFTSVVNILRTLEAPRMVSAGSTWVTFDQWSESEHAREFAFEVPEASKTFHAIFKAIPAGNGSGLKGQYFNQHMTFNGTPDLERLDAAINFNWLYTSPGEAINSDHFTVRWTGELLAPISGDYRFSAVADDGARLWINGELMVNTWPDGGGQTLTDSIELGGGQKYPVTLEYYEETGTASVQLLWGSSEFSEHVIPSTQLFGEITTANEAENSVSQLIAYPTIATDRLYLQNLSGKHVHWRIFNATAQEVMEGELNGASSVDLNDLRPGLYVLKFESGQTVRFLKK